MCVEGGRGREGECGYVFKEEREIVCVYLYREGDIDRERGSQNHAQH